jgi:hypothetical protein
MGSAQHFDAFEHDAEGWPLQAIAASDYHQRQADGAGSLRRESRVSKSGPERERADRKPHRLSGESQLACLARVHADDRDLLGV